MNKSRFFLGPVLLIAMALWVLFVIWWLEPDKPVPATPTPALLTTSVVRTLVTLEAGPVLPTKTPRLPIILVVPSPEPTEALPRYTATPTLTPTATLVPTAAGTSTRVPVQKG